MKAKKSDSKNSNKGKVSLKKSIWKNREEVINAIFSDDSWAEDIDQDKDTKVPSEGMFSTIQSRIGQQENKRLARKVRFVQLARYSAAACVLMVSAFFLWQYSSRLDVSVSRNTANTLVDVSLPAYLKSTIWLEQVNSSKVSKRIILPDGSEVKLYPNSQVRYLANFAATHREVLLKGKAYFQVKKDSARPFSVYGNQTKTTALGTSFTIDARKTTAVTLHTGKIVVASTVSTFKKIFLQAPGEELLFNQNHQLARRYKPAAQTKAVLIAEEEYAGKQYFDNIAIEQVIGVLCKLYHVDIQAAPAAIHHIHYTGSINPEKETIEDVLNVICLINDLRWTKTNDGIYHIQQQEKINNELN